MQRQVLGHVRLMGIGIVGVSLCLIVGGLVLAMFGLLWWPFALLAFVPLLVVHRLSDGGRMLDPYPWIRGWRGESGIKKLLKGLEPLGYRIVNHLDIGRGDVDHAVVGPTGVFAIETKNHAGRFARDGASLTKNGYPVDDILNQAMREAIAVRDRVDVPWVEAVVVVPRGDVDGSRMAFPRVTVLDGDGLLPFITSRGEHLDPSEVERIAQLLRRAH
jgi:hypothetical protein